MKQEKKTYQPPEVVDVGAVADATTYSDTNVRDNRGETPPKYALNCLCVRHDEEVDLQDTQ
jgi:hypothetical protein